MQKAVFDISGVSVEQAYQLSRAFGFYFELINLAETNHRKRRRLSSQVTGDTHSQRGTLRGTLSAMKPAGISAEAALEWLGRIFIVPVFTAHPTEVARRSVMFKRRRIGDSSRSSSIRFPSPTKNSSTCSSNSPPRSPRSGKPTRSAAASPPSMTRSRWASTSTTPRSSPR